jgi:hypothetical protein
MGGHVAYNARKKSEIHTKVHSKNVKKRDQLGDLDLDDMILFKRLLTRQDVN